MNNLKRSHLLLTQQFLYDTGYDIHGWVFDIAEKAW
jgi:hypothetical protein